MTRLVRSLGPWLVFLLASRLTPVPVAVALGLLASLVVLCQAYRYNTSQQAQAQAAQPGPHEAGLRFQ